MAVVEADPNLGAQIVADTKEHVLYSWSSAEPDRSDPGRGGGGASFLGLRGQALSGLRLTAHRPPAPEDHPGDQGPGRPALHDRPAARERVPLDARPDARGSDPGRPVRLVLHERRRRGQRERREARAARHRPSQGHRALPLLPRCDRMARSRSRAIRVAGRWSRACPASCACSTRTRIAARPVTPTRAPSAPARRTSRRSSSTRERTPSPR